MKVVALTEVYYEKTRNPGDVFDCEEQHGNLLKVIGKVREATPDDEGKSERKSSRQQAPAVDLSKLETRDESAQGSAPVTSMTTENTEGLTPRQRYLRRDMKAKE